MEPVPVNWDALDSLVLDFVLSENLVVDASPPTTLSSVPSSSSYRSRLLILQIRRAIEFGDIDAAIELVRHHTPSILDDQRLLFRLQKQKFVELLRKGSSNDRDSAIECLRTSFAPCALNAFPEAYEDFKHTLLALIFDKEDQTSPVADVWLEARRTEIGGLLSSLLVSYLDAYDPIFSMTLKYLISIHKVFCFRQGVTSSISDLTERLLLEEHDPPAIPHESLCEAPPFDEVDIQALAHAVELTRQGAVDSLRFAKGDLLKAFQNELSRMKFNIPILDEMVHEYCLYRGIVAIGVGSYSGNSSHPNVEHGLLSQSDGEISDNTSMLSTGIELRFSNGSTSSVEDCSTSESRRVKGSCRRSQRSRNETIDGFHRKRWRGRSLWKGFAVEVHSDGSNKEGEVSVQDAGGSQLEEQIPDSVPILENTQGLEHKYETILKISNLVSKEMTPAVVEEVNSMDPNFFAENPNLLFQLKQVEFFKLVNAGKHAEALGVASSHMGPLAVNNPSLLKLLKETLLALLGPEESPARKGLSLSVLATSVQVALGRRLGLEEPQLMKIMRTTLHSHTEWFKLQMCKDRFEQFLKIDSLKELDAPFSAASRTSHECNNDSQSSISPSNGTVEDVSIHGQALPGDVVQDESAILKVMEFLALPRADAIHLLAQYNGNAETVIQQIFA